MRHALKVLFAVALVFSFIGFANADGIPTVTDPYNLPTVWIQDVYNGSGTAIQSGQAVRWDCDASTGTYVQNDMAMWVEEVGAAADVRTAGATPYGYTGLTAGAVGFIVVKGPVIMYDAGNACTTCTGANGIVESDGNGSPIDHTFVGTNEAMLGWCINTLAINANSALTSATYSIHFIDPTLSVDD